MDNSLKYEGRLTRAVLSCDLFTTGYLAVCLFLSVPYVMSRGGIVVLSFLPIACLVPFALLPLFYMLVHRADTLLFGRYHLVMPLSAFIAALFFVIAFGAADCSTAGGACAVFFGGTVFMTTVLLYRYCAFSVRARLDGDDLVSPSPYKSAFSAAGGLSAMVTFIGFLYYDAQTAFINTAYVIGGANLVLALLHYLTSYYGIPRLGGKRAQSVKGVFRMFYQGVDKRTYFSSLLFKAAFCTVTALGVYFAQEIGMPFEHVCGAIAAEALFYGVAYCVCAYRVNRRSMNLSVIALSCYAFGCILLIIVACGVTSGGVTVSLMVGAAAAVGVGGAVTARQTQLRFLTIKPRITGGVVFMMTELTSAAAAAIAVAVAAIVGGIGISTHTYMSFIFGFAAAVVFAVAAFAVAGKKTAESSAPAATYEYGTTE